jgi:hypothetical protein
MAKEPVEPWRLDTNDRYRDFVKMVVSLATAVLVLPVFFLKDVVALPKERPLSDALNDKAYWSWICLALSIACGLAYHYVSGKWVRLAWDQEVAFFAKKSKSQETKNRVETFLECSLWGCILAFVVGLGLTMWFVVTVSSKH